MSNILELLNDYMEYKKDIDGFKKHIEKKLKKEEKSEKGSDEGSGSENEKKEENKINIVFGASLDCEIYPEK